MNKKQVFGKHQTRDTAVKSFYEAKRLFLKQDLNLVNVSSRPTTFTHTTGRQALPRDTRLDGGTAVGPPWLVAQPDSLSAPFKPACLPLSFSQLFYLPPPPIIPPNHLPSSLQTGYRHPFPGGLYQRSPITCLPQSPRVILQFLKNYWLIHSI